MYHDTTRHHPGLAAVLVAAVAAVQVLALTLIAAPGTATVPEPQAATPAMLPEIVVTAPRIGG